MTVDEFLKAFRNTHQKFPACVRPSGNIRHTDKWGEARCPIVMVTLHHYGSWPAKGGPSQLHNCASALELGIWDAHDIERAADGYYIMTEYQRHLRHRMMDIVTQDSTPTTENEQ